MKHRGVWAEDLAPLSSFIGVDSPRDIIKVENILLRQKGEPHKLVDKRLRVREIFNYLNVFSLWVVPLVDLNTRLYFEIHLFRFKWGCYIEGVKLWG